MLKLQKEGRHESVYLLFVSTTNDYFIEPSFQLLCFRPLYIARTHIFD